MLRLSNLEIRNVMTVKTRKNPNLEMELNPWKDRASYDFSYCRDYFLCSNNYHLWTLLFFIHTQITKYERKQRKYILIGLQILGVMKLENLQLKTYQRSWSHRLAGHRLDLCIYQYVLQMTSLAYSIWEILQFYKNLVKPQDVDRGIIEGRNDNSE
jgi:hypothetical protein